MINKTFRSKKWRALALSLVLGVSVLTTACDKDGMQSNLSQEALWQKHQADLMAFQDWKFDGRMAATGLPLSATLGWEQHQEQFEGYVSGPLGLGAFSVTGVPSKVTITMGGRDFEVDDPEKFVRQRLGVQIPLKYLRFWMKGLPAPNISHQNLKINADGSVESFAQGDWEVSYTDYQKLENQDQSSLLLPNKMTAKSGNVVLKIIVSGWEKLGAKTAI